MWTGVLILNIAFSLLTAAFILAAPVFGPVAMFAIAAGPGGGIPGTALSVALLIYLVTFFLSFIKCQRARVRREVTGRTLAWAVAPAVAALIVWQAPSWGRTICARGLSQCLTGTSDDADKARLGALFEAQRRDYIPLPGQAQPMERENASRQCEREESQKLAWFWKQRPDEATRAAKVRELMHNCLVAQHLPDSEATRPLGQHQPAQTNERKLLGPFLPTD